MLLLPVFVHFSFVILQPHGRQDSPPPPLGSATESLPMLAFSLPHAFFRRSNARLLSLHIPAKRRAN